MASDSDEEFDGDDGFEADMEALMRACVLAGASPGHGDDDLSGRAVSNSVPSSPGTDDGVDDVELVRDIQKRFALSTDVQVPLDMRPICSIFPTEGGNESEDVIETLRAIERRFASYYDDTTKEGLDKELNNTEQMEITVPFRFQKVLYPRVVALKMHHLKVLASLSQDKLLLMQ
nr:snRNA-activating protein complex subunit 4 isoform X2 [Ipomoea batatas]